MLAERVPGLLPDLKVRDALEVSAVHSLAGFYLADKLITKPPFSDPHHSASVASIVGGGQRMAKPGLRCWLRSLPFPSWSSHQPSTAPPALRNATTQDVVSLTAHKGVLFLDDFTEARGGLCERSAMQAPARPG
jgi:magnesium chelatase family protein